MFFTIHFLKNIANFCRKTPVLESLFNKVAGLRACIFIKKRLQHRCFPVTFHLRIFKNTLQNTSGGCFWIGSQLLYCFATLLEEEVWPSTLTFLILFITFIKSITVVIFQGLSQIIECCFVQLITKKLQQ